MNFILLFCFFGCFAAENEIFKTKANIIYTFIIPIFSNHSSFSDFNETLNFFLALNYEPDSVCIYSAPNTYSCGSEIFTNESILSDIYIFSKTYNSASDRIELAESETPEKQLCGHSGYCNGKRYNFIILSDFLNASATLQSFELNVKQIFYFAILSNNLNCDNNTVCFNIIKDEPNDTVSDIIFEPAIYYVVDFSIALYNFFLVLNESEVDLYVLIPAIIQYYDFYRSEDAILFVAAIQKNETYFYESAAILTYQNYFDLIWSLKNFIYSNSTKLSTKLAEKYFKKSFETDQNNEYLNEYYQWNVVITHSFPFWIQNTNLRFDYESKYLDVYICSSNDTDNYEENLKDLSNHLNDIIIDDVNATFRHNHIMVFDSYENLMYNEQYLPTGKGLMPIKLIKFDNKNSNQNSMKWWIWVIIGSVFALVLIIALISFLFWRRRMHRIIAEKYTWALQAGFTKKEAETITEKGKELYIDENGIQVDFKDVKGKGSSAIVYGGFLNSTSPVSILYPSMETKNYKNCKVAIKIVNKYGKDDYEQIFREVDAAVKLGWHRHICCLLGWSIHQSTPALLYESIDGGDLFTWIKGFTDSSASIPEKLITQILWQISDGMEYISENGIVHKDLAARNILLTSGFVVKITDFGLASSCDESFTYQAPLQRRLPIRWMAPEALTDRLFSEASDCWSFGVLAWELFNNCAIPYGNIDGNDILEYLNSGKRLEFLDGISEEWIELLNGCWKSKKDERPSFRNIKAKLSIFLEKYTQDYGYLSVNE